MGYHSVFSQVIKQIPRGEFESWVRNHGGDHGVRTLNCCTWFGALLFGQLSRNDSVRAIERVFGHGQGRMRHLGFGEVCRSTLADANRTRGHICDQTIYLKSHRGQRYHGTLRRISYRDPDTNKRLTFLTNRFDLAVQTICDLYKARWQVELFFKTLKQHLKIRKFLGTTENAVSAQILVALIAYLLVMLLRYAYKSTISIPETMALLAALLLLNMPLALILKDLPATTRYPPDPQLSFPF